MAPEPPVACSGINPLLMLAISAGCAVFWLFGALPALRWLCLATDALIQRINL